MLGLPSTLHAVFEALETDHDDTQVVERLETHSLYEEGVDCVATCLVEEVVAQVLGLVGALTTGSISSVVLA